MDINNLETFKGLITKYDLNDRDQLKVSSIYKFFEEATGFTSSLLNKNLHCNREIFVNYINSFFANYKRELEGAEEVTCESIARAKRFGDFSLLTHQLVVRDYLNLKTPYRGLLLYHGLGAGKTCGSIGIAEGMKTTKKIVIMAPASLIPNYIGELKFCGDPMYKLKQYWEFIPTERNLVKEKQMAQILSISRNYIRRAGGAWLVNKNEKESNFNTLTSTQKESLNKQIKVMIENKYQFIAYNGYRMSHLESDTDNFTKNPFDNKVIIVDEAQAVFAQDAIQKLPKPFLDSLHTKNEQRKVLSS